MCAGWFYPWGWIVFFFCVIRYSVFLMFCAIWCPFCLLSISALARKTLRVPTSAVRYRYRTEINFLETNRNSFLFVRSAWEAIRTRWWTVRDHHIVRGKDGSKTISWCFADSGDTVSLTQCCGYKYIEFGSGSRVMFSFLKEKIINKFW